MRQLLLYNLFDLLKAQWLWFYTGFFFILTSGLIILNPQFSKVILTLLNVVLVLVPLLTMILGLNYYYNNREFVEIILAQPVKRVHVFLGQYASLAIGLCIGMMAGIGIPFVIFGLLPNSPWMSLLLLLISGCFLTLIFLGLSFVLALKFENRLKAFALALFAWIFFSILYDGIFLILLSTFDEYPLERMALFFTVFNPIDLSRILILLDMDVSALMGYTGAVFKKILGNHWGVLAAVAVLLCWIVFPLWRIIRISSRKDF